MKTTHLEYITKKCQEANPDLLKLSFGCYVKTDKLNLYRISNPLNIISGVVYESLESDTTHGKITEILGHPPQLSNVLMALGKDYASDGQGLLWQRTVPVQNREYSGCEYDLSKPLSEQSEETLLWIAEQLGFSDLSLPEYEETRKQLTGLLDKNGKERTSCRGITFKT